MAYKINTKINIKNYVVVIETCNAIVCISLDIIENISKPVQFVLTMTQLNSCCCYWPTY